MTPEQIIEMAREAGMTDTWDGWVTAEPKHCEGVFFPQLEAFAKLVAKATQERIRLRLSESLDEDAEVDPIENFKPGEGAA